LVWTAYLWLENPLLLKLVSAALEAGLERGVWVSVVVCGVELQVVALARADFAAPHSVQLEAEQDVEIAEAALTVALLS
jgi:uncharacterized protein GlcG (DUF336 family)